MPTAEFLRARITTPGKRGSKYGTCLFIVKETFEKHLGKEFHRHPEPNKVNTLFLFVGDLLYSLHRRKSMVCFLRFDELLSTVETLPPELRIPLRNLWALMRPAEPELPVPRHEVLVRDVADFEQILSSGLFTQYEEKSSELDLVSSPVAASLREAHLSAQRLVRANERLLRLGATPMRLLSLTTKAIDAVFGRLPGALADFAVGEANQFLGADKRLVIYFAERLLSGINEPGSSEILQILGRHNKL